MKVKTKQAKVVIPIVLSFQDYHEINSTLDTLNAIFGGKLKAKELGCDYDYYAIFYFKKDEEYQDLVKTYRAEHEAEDEDQA